MLKKIASILGRIFKGLSCRSSCCCESSCNEKEKNEIIEEVVEVAHHVIDAIQN